ncbi:UNKNOWN [Stylonychia lemnae]|uniref:Transmembrane protein n=1 Tax=Stylonychia lemnae TaxID=5949 RepID=A0A077ZQA3_STYLE|nr:UNKNOWN [Stylonychia lemnae]|eukprot:CDW72092.1 UNKNOWN [Stylonychia lemnae]
MRVSSMDDYLLQSQSQLFEDAQEQNITSNKNDTSKIFDMQSQNGENQWNFTRSSKSRINKTRSTYKQSNQDNHRSNILNNLEERLNAANDKQNLKTIRGGGSSRSASSKSYSKRDYGGSSYSNGYAVPIIIGGGGYYHSNNYYQDSSDSLCKNHTCQFCCVKGVCQDEAYCKDIKASKDQKSMDAGEVIFLIILLITCCGSCFVLHRYMRRRQRHTVKEPLIHNSLSHSPYHSHQHHNKAQPEHQNHPEHNQQQYYIPQTNVNQDSSLPHQQQLYNPILNYQQVGQLQLQEGHIPLADQQNLQQQQLLNPPISYPPNQGYASNDIQSIYQQSTSEQILNFQAQENQKQQYFVPPTQQQQYYVPPTQQQQYYVPPTLQQQAPQ